MESTPNSISSKHFLAILSFDSCSVYLMPQVRNVFGAASRISFNLSAPVINKSISANSAAAASSGVITFICVSFVLPLSSSKSLTV